ncbi:hypothetical protein [Microbulbifer yueqingensis]|uniref:Uncharacterized protein n=1 Tax=Microbulbifer yueqingensis TaxID=658219 RepID=A0A1G8VX84_9GAMM|nr:hypothetical protein [Microbulbifer yueqingensis]SDJ70711.1 hypothetical protein SAMN05216212_0775 [Microbulbifer yueqingensis]
MNVPTYLAFTCALLGSQVQAKETLQLTILTAAGREYLVEHPIEESEGAFASGVLGSEPLGREYLAIRCGGSWGAQRYRLTLPSGPGYQLELTPESILLRIVEHDVINEDSTIEAMRIHCTDVEPRAVVRSVAKIQLDRGKEDKRELELPNGYRLLYSYSPASAD